MRIDRTYAAQPGHGVQLPRWRGLNVAELLTAVLTKAGPEWLLILLLLGYIGWTRKIEDKMRLSDLRLKIQIREALKQLQAGQTATQSAISRLQAAIRNDR